MVLGTCTSASTGEKYTIRLSIDSNRYHIEIIDKNEFMVIEDTPIGDINELTNAISCVIKSYSV